MIKSNDEDGLTVEMKEEDDDVIRCTTKSEMGEVIEENEKLKQLISNVAKDYKSLQTQFFQALQHDEAKNFKTEEPSHSHEEIKEDPQLVSLSLGRNNSIDSSSEAIKEVKRNKGLSLELDRFDEPKKQETLNPETWPPSKVFKTIRSSPEELPPLKKARVSIRTRCDLQTVQRCFEDMSILVTTYEGTHNHPLPPSATAMTSTTSVAASMLKSQSSQSRLGSSISVPLSNSATTSALNFGNKPQNRFYFSKSSMPTSNSHPTITLDLTNYNLSDYSTTKIPNSLTGSYSPSCTALNFSSSSLEHYNFDTTSWNSSTYNYGPLQQHGKMGNHPHHQQHFYKPCKMQLTYDQPEKSIKESIAAATEMIASNPSFQSALAAAVSSYVGCRSRRMDQSTFNLNLGDGAAHS